MPQPPHFHQITPFDVFELGSSLEKVVVIALIAAIAAALAVLAMKLSSRGRLAGGSAFLSGLRLGGPIIGGLGACYSLLAMTLGYASVPGNLPLKALAPGFAECFLQVGLGFFVGAIAVFAHWAVESRIDRQVLGA